MNCKPSQMAWIVVPAGYAGTGIEKVNGNIVRTVALLPDYTDPTWSVTPEPLVTIRVNAIDFKGYKLKAGEFLRAHAIPDAWLRPFDPASEPGAETTERELELHS